MKKIQRIDALFEFLRVVLGLVIAYVIAIIFIAISVGSVDAAKDAIYNFMLGPLLTQRRWGQLMAKFIPYVLMGCGYCFIYSAGRFSLIGEGIVNFAPIITCLLMFNTGIMTGFPLIVNLGIMILSCVLIGAAVATIPAFAREKMRQSEMVVSIIMNYMLLFLSLWVLKMWLFDKTVSMQATKEYPVNMRFPTLLSGTSFHAGIFVAIIGWIIAVILFSHTKLGQKIRTCGGNASFAIYSGIGASGTVFLAQVIGGAFAGAAACTDAFGLYTRYQYNMLTNIGMDGLIVAVIAQKKPIYVPLAALVLAYIRTSAVVLNLSSNIPVEFVNMMQAILIFFIAAEQFLKKSRNKVIFRVARKEAAN